LGDLSLRELKQESLWRGLKDDPFTFAEEFWHIQRPEGGFVRFELRDSQREALEKWLGGGNWLTLKARQIGWSTVVAFYATWVAMFTEGAQVVLLSRGEREAKDLLAKAKDGYYRLPHWMKKKCMLRNDNVLNMKFGNGSQIEALPSASDPARGRSATLVVVDEWAFFPRGDEAWASIEPVADIGGQIIGLSTANGLGNFFHDFWERAQQGETGFGTMFYGWDAVPERDDAWYEQKVGSLAEWQLHQEYPRNPTEAFIKSGRPVFSVEHVEAYPAQEPSRGYLTEGGQFRVEEGGPLRIWKFPEAHARYVIGADVAEGLAHGDYSVAQVICVGTGELVACWHGHVDPDLFGGQVLHDLGLLYNSALMAVESNNHGIATITALRRRNYPFLFRPSNDLHRERPMKDTLGFRTTGRTKPMIIDELNRALRDQDLLVFDAETRRELLSYQRNDNGRMSGSPYDDRVMSLAIGQYVVQFASEPQYVPKRDSYWTVDWWLNLDRPQEDDGWLIGDGATF
jgi:hypothetical protein